MSMKIAQFKHDYAEQYPEPEPDYATEIDKLVSGEDSFFISQKSFRSAAEDALCDIVDDVLLYDLLIAISSGKTQWEIFKLAKPALKELDKLAFRMIKRNV